MTRAVTLILPLLILVYLSSTAPVLAQQGLKTSLSHEVRIHDHGLISIDTTVSYVNDGTTAAPIGSFEIRYPKALYGQVSAYSSEPKLQSLGFEQTADKAKITATSPSSMVLQPGGRASVRITLLLMEALRTAFKDHYVFTAPIVPETSLGVGEVAVTVILPQFSTIVSQHSGLTTSQEKNRPVLKGALPPSPVSQDILFKVEALGFTIVAFPEGKREIFVDPLGAVSVRDTVEVVNTGNWTLRELKLNPLKGGVPRVSIVPSTTPPLTSSRTIPIVNDTLPLLSAYGRPLEKGERRLITFEYPYPRESSQIEGQKILLEVPVTAPVVGVIKDFKVAIRAPEAFEVSKSEVLKVTNAGHLGGQEFIISVRPKLSWAAVDVMPSATAVFIGAFSFLVLSSRLARAEVSERLGSIAELRRVLEEKVDETGRLFSNLERAGPGQSTRRDLEEVRMRLDESKARISRRLQEIGGELGKGDKNIQNMFQQVKEADRVLDREARGLLNAYRVYHTGGGKGLARSSIEDYAKRLTKAEENLMEQLDRLAAYLS